MAVNAKECHINAFRTNKESFELIGKISEQTGFEKQDITRWLLNMGLELIKAKIIAAKGIENLEFNVKEIKRINQ